MKIIWRATKFETNFTWKIWLIIKIIIWKKMLYYCFWTVYWHVLKTLQNRSLYSEANNKYMKNFYPTKLAKFIEYLDKNNLYDWKMSQYLLYGTFKLLKNVDEFDVNSISEKSPIGYILEADISVEYLDESHKLHNDRPLAPEKLARVSSHRHCGSGIARSCKTTWPEVHLTSKIGTH